MKYTYKGRERMSDTFANRNARREIICFALTSIIPRYYFDFFFLFFGYKNKFYTDLLGIQSLQSSCRVVIVS